MQRIVQSVEKVNNDSLKNLLSQLRPEDYRIKRQIEAILIQISGETGQVARYRTA